MSYTIFRFALVLCVGFLGGMVYHAIPDHIPEEVAVPQVEPQQPSPAISGPVVLPDRQPVARAVEAQPEPESVHQPLPLHPDYTFEEVTAHLTQDQLDELEAIRRTYCPVELRPGEADWLLEWDLAYWQGRCGLTHTQHLAEMLTFIGPYRWIEETEGSVLYRQGMWSNRHLWAPLIGRDKPTLQ